ncbi:phosphoribosylglycinamide formyltransferase [Paenibacillus sedimenti]|uniref:phosphoribosylglycinamide formyltransferase 1 n=1 Tax=Paenibacillus sedimenti TaxID=2770274 RepID=A0A926KL70_9BACL|nr:formyltransferase family protein [Paenibacillus sedimenti]MBD0379695.1 hypothetical protein [Paenibacillus sedimenti]
MIKICFLCSGNGGNLRFINKCIQKKIIPNIELVGIIADRHCEAITFAQYNNLSAYKINYSRKNNAELKEALISLNPDIIVTNFHKILDEEIVNLFKGKLINLHYSLLPAFGGVIGDKPVRMALDTGCKFVGTTVHFVDEEVDNGFIISQNLLPVANNSEFQVIMNEVFRMGCVNLLNAILHISNQEISIENNLSNIYGYERNEIVSSPPFNHSMIFNEDFWRSI